MESRFGERARAKSKHTKMDHGAIWFDGCVLWGCSEAGRGIVASNEDSRDQDQIWLHTVVEGWWIVQTIAMFISSAIDLR